MIKNIQIFLTLCITIPAVAFAQNKITINSTVDKDKILIGDVVTYSVEVAHDEDVELQMPSLAANLGAFEIRDYKVVDPVKRDNEVVEQTNYSISTFDTGEFEIPALAVQFRAIGDSTWQSIKSEPILITVASLDPDSTGDIRDIKLPKTPPQDYRAIVKWSLIGLLGPAFVAFLIYYIKRRREGKSLLPRRARPQRPAHEIALEALDDLVKSDLLSSGEVKEYYTRLSDIVRQYIQDRYFIMALEMTTTQLLRAMQDASLAETSVATIADLFSTCDLVKFAAFMPDEATHEIKTKSAFDFINDTKLVIVETNDSGENAKSLDDESLVVEEADDSEEEEAANV